MPGSPISGNGNHVMGCMDPLRAVPGSTIEESNCSECVDPSEEPVQMKGGDGSGASVSSPDMQEWKRLVEDCASTTEASVLSPLRYLLDELAGGGALHSTTTIGNEQKRERVYNTMFHVPWRCELLIDIGFFVCLDSFLSLFTVMPARILLFMRRLFSRRRLFQRPHADELSDVGCLIVLYIGVKWLQQADISLIYHLIRGASAIKLYVIYNVLEILDKLCQSLGSDVLQVLFNSALGVASCSNESLMKESARFVFDQFIAIVCFTVHSFIILSQAITVSAAINSQNNALLTMLISNNFAEIKSNVFKRLGKENLHKMAYHDTVERFHIITFLLFVLAQNILSAEGPWMLSFLKNAGKIVVCEIVVDVIKHAFLAKFNEIKPAAYSEFLLSLCKQTLHSRSHEVHKTLAFVPLAPACVVIRVLIPLYATLLPQGNLFRRSIVLFFICLGTYFMLTLAKIAVGLGLQLHARWYIERRLTKAKQHVE